MRVIAVAAPLAAWRRGPFSRLERERHTREKESSSVSRRPARPIARTAFFSTREAKNDRESGER